MHTDGTMSWYIALLRGINVGGHNKIPMAELRELVVGLGWTEVSTYIQSGNLVFVADEGAERSLGKYLEEAIAARWNIEVPAVVRSLARWGEYAAGNPFREASEAEPARVMLALARDAIAPDALGAITAKSGDTERVRQVADAIWIHFGSGAGRSKITPSVLDRSAGSPITMRNWRTVLALLKMTHPPESS